MGRLIQEQNSWLFSQIIDSNIIIDHNDNPSKSFNWIAPIQALCLVIVIVVPSQLALSEFTAVPLVISFGMMNNWINKQGYVPQGMTGNVHKISETLYKLTFWITVEEKERTDVKVISVIFLVYTLGCIVSVFVIYAFNFTTLDSKRGSLIVILALVPIKYYLIGGIQVNCLYASNQSLTDNCCEDSAQSVAIHIEPENSSIQHNDEDI